jgi:methylenetetrahydrofolate dehydrogenase (NADP+) / methenyltetrahydrofolate cyclohydrolase
MDMSGRLIDGRAIAAELSAEVGERVRALLARDVVPRLAVVVPTEDEGTAWYVRSIARAAGKLGIDCRTIGPSLTSAEVVAELAALSADPTVHGVMCQTPLPAGLNAVTVGSAIHPAKDVDGANPRSAGLLSAGAPGYPPATAAAVLAILRHEGVPLAGRHAVVLGRSTVVGRADATVTVCHSRTSDLAAHTRRADVLVVAAGRAGLIGAEHVSPGAVVIDVGTNPTPDGGLVGDVVTEEVARVLGRVPGSLPDPGQRLPGREPGAVTPVPGGVGPVTTATLLGHVVAAAEAATSA